MHCKVIGAAEGADKLLSKTRISNKLADNKEKTVPSVIIGDGEAFSTEFITALGKHRIWEREEKIVE